MGGVHDKASQPRTPLRTLSSWPVLTGASPRALRPASCRSAAVGRILRGGGCGHRVPKGTPCLSQRVWVIGPGQDGMFWLGGQPQGGQDSMFGPPTNHTGGQWPVCCLVKKNWGPTLEGPRSHVWVPTTSLVKTPVGWNLYVPLENKTEMKNAASNEASLHIVMELQEYFGLKYCSPRRPSS